MMRALRHSVLGLSLALAGCAAALPGYVPPSKTRDRMLAHTPTGGGFDNDGTYRLTDQEQKLDCKALTGSMTVKILQMREADSRVEGSFAARTTQRVISPIKRGTRHGIDASDDLARDRARLDTLNRQLVAKGCKSFDLDRVLARDNAERPTPTIDPPAKG